MSVPSVRVACDALHACGRCARQVCAGSVVKRIYALAGIGGRMRGTSTREVKAEAGNRKMDAESERHTKGAADEIMPTAIKQQPAIACRSGQQDFFEWSM
jgi:hypothetical protein